MAEHPIQGLMGVTMDKIREMVDANTIIGSPIKTDDGTTILPVSRVTFGFASGGSDFEGKNVANKDLFGGGSGAGVSVSPVAFLIIKNGTIRTIQIPNQNSSMDRVVTMLPELVDRLQELLPKKGTKAAKAADAAPEQQTVVIEQTENKTAQ